MYNNLRTKKILPGKEKLGTGLREVGPLRQTIPRNGLVLEGLLNGNALDTSGNGNNGTATNISYIESNSAYGKQSASFNGTSGYISTPIPSTFFVGTQNFSFVVWLNTTNSGNNKSIFGLANNTSSFNDLVGLSKITSNKLQIVRKEGTPLVSYKTAISTTSINTGGDFFCVGTYDGSNLKIYINGIFEATSTSTGSVVQESGTIPNIMLGRNGNYSPAYQYWSGMIQNTRIYNRALSQKEISLLYYEGLKLLH